MPATATDELADFVAETRLTDIPHDVRARGRLIVADCVACMVAGAVVPEVRRLARCSATAVHPPQAYSAPGSALPPMRRLSSTAPPGLGTISTKET